MVGLVSSTRFVLRRLLFSAVTLLGVSLFLYIMAVSLGGSFLRHQSLVGYYHSDLPLYQGYLLWLSEILRGNLGISSGTPVLEAILPRIVPTVSLQVPAIAVSAALGLLIGVHSASRYGSKRDGVITAASATLFGIPAYWLGTVLIIVFSGALHLLPSNGMLSPYPPYWWGNRYLDVLAHFLLPFSVLTVVSVPIYVKLARASAVEVMSKEWVTALTVASVSRSRIIYRHVLRNAVGPVLAAMVYNLAVFLAASPGIEVVFSWPGMGYALAEAALQSDQTIMLGIVLIMTVITVAVSFAADLLQAAIDPRVSLS